MMSLRNFFIRGISPWHFHHWRVPYMDFPYGISPLDFPYGIFPDCDFPRGFTSCDFPSCGVPHGITLAGFYLRVISPGAGFSSSVISFM